MKAFLLDQTPENSLHVRFDIVTGQVLADSNSSSYPHLQLDCISLFLLSLVQIISSGLEVSYHLDLCNSGLASGSNIRREYQQYK